MRIKIPSLELNWLPASIRVGIDQPHIVLTDRASYSGAYWRRTRVRYITPFDCDLREGAIIELCIDATPATIVHEYRHHLQRERRLFPTFQSFWAPKDDTSAAYWAEIRRFFTAHAEELDALMFEVRHAPNEVNLAWVDALKISYRTIRSWAALRE